MNVKKSWFFVILLIISLAARTSEISAEKIQTCTIVTVSDEDTVLFLNNEDNAEMNQGRIYFYPAKNGKNGRVLFGYRFYDCLDICIGGVNDQGLCFDQNGLHNTAPAEHPEKEQYKGVISLKMLEDCSSVEEVRESINKYWGWARIENQQMHFADNSGDACVFGLDSVGELFMTNKTTDFLVSTNIELAQYDTSFISEHCWRYQTAVDMLNYSTELSISFATEILKQVALPQIMYAYIIDLIHMQIYLFAQDDFEHVVVIDIHEELAKGQHSYSIDDLVKKEHGVAEYNFKVATVLIFLSLFGLNVALYFLMIRPKIKRNPEGKV